MCARVCDATAVAAVSVMSSEESRLCFVCSLLFVFFFTLVRKYKDRLYMNINTETVLIFAFIGVLL